MTTDATELPRHCAWCEPHTPGATSYICEECEEVMGRAEDHDDDAGLILEAALEYASKRLDLQAARGDDINRLSDATTRAFRRLGRMVDAALENARER